MSSPRSAFPSAQSAGIALVVTLMMMSVLVMMVVGLAGVMRNEQAAARNLTYQVLAEQLAEAASQQGMTAVVTSTPTAGQITATGPGWIQAGSSNRFLVSPAAVAADIRNLESIGTNSLILGLPAGVRGAIFAGWSNVIRPNQPTNRPIGRYAWWVDDEGTKLNLNAVGSNNLNPFLPLRTRALSGVDAPGTRATFPFSADWVFADPASGTTTNTNAARYLRERTNWLPTPESLKGTNFLAAPSTNLALSSQEYHRIKGNITTWSANADLTPWGALKVNLADLTNTNTFPTPQAAAAQIKAMLTTNVWTNISGANRTLARKYGGGALTAGAAGNAGDILMDQITANILSVAGRTSPVVLHTNNTNNFDPLRQRFGIPASPVGLTPSPFLNEVAVSVSSRDLNSNPPEIVVTFYFQIEVFNPWPTASPGGYTLELQPRKLRFHIGYNRNPPNVVPLVIPNFGGTWPDSAGANNGITGSLGCWAGPMMEDIPWPAGDVLTSSLGSIPARSMQTVSLSQSFRCVFPSGLNPPLGNMLVDQAYVVIDKIVLRVRNADGTPGDPVDWVTLDDFAQRGNYGSTNTSRYVNAATNDYGQLNFSPNYPFGNSGYIFRTIDAVPSALPPPTFSAGNSLGLAKNDPRVRFPTRVWATTNGSFRPNGFSDGTNGLQAWRRVMGGGGAVPSVTLGSQNPAGIYTPTGTNGVVTGVAYLDPDPVPAATPLLQHPHFVEGYTLTPPPTGTGIRSVAQLGAIHTGLPWRTLRFQPTSALELAQGPPDWILLEGFTATNPATLLPRVNLNGLVASLQASNSTNPGVPLNSSGGIQTRTWALLGAMGALRTNLSTPSTNFFSSNGIPQSLTGTNSMYGSNGLRQIALNLSNVLASPNGVTNSGWALNSGWPGLRASRSSNFPAQGLGLTGELLEVRGVADGTAGEDVVEGRLRGFLDMVTTRSDTFSVWSIGQGLMVLTNAQGLPIRTNVMGEARKQTVFQREPVVNGGVVTGYQYRAVYTRSHVVE